MLRRCPNEAASAVRFPARAYGIAALALYGVLAACAGGDSDVPSETVTVSPSLTGAQVVRFPAKDPETDRFAVDGVIDENGKCRLGRQFESPPGVTTRVFESVVEFDPTSCKFVVARHPPEAIPDHVQEDFRTFREQIVRNRQ